MRAIVVLTAAVAMLLGMPTTAQARGTGPELAIRADNVRSPVVTVTNRGTEPCAVVANALGTITLSRVTQNGAVVEPVATLPSFDDDLGYQLRADLRTVPPGGSVDLPLPVVPAGPTGVALQTVSWTPQLTAGSLYPVDPAKPLRLDVVYQAPVEAANGTPMCGRAQAIGGPADSGSGPRWTIWVGGVIAGLGVAAVVVLLLRRRRPAAAGTALALLAVTVAVLGPVAPAAHAKITFADQSIADAAGPCMKSFRSYGGDTSDILPTLDAANVSVGINRSVGSNGEQKAFGAIIVYWNPDDHATFQDGVAHDPCEELYHELYHAYEDTKGPLDLHECVTADGTHTGISTAEVHATQAENKHRAIMGRPIRTTYGDHEVPVGQCRPPKPDDPICTAENGCPPQQPSAPPAGSSGDPHIVTFDGRRFDFQADGEFVAALDRSASGANALQIQVRQRAVEGARHVSMNTAVAADVGGDRVEARIDNGTFTVLVNGAEQPAQSRRLPHGGNLTFSPGNQVTLDWADGTRLIVIGGFSTLSVNVWPAPARAGKLTGLFGDFDGNKANDIRVGGGAPIVDPTFDALYPRYADSLRVTAQTSLFTYPPGTDTETYTDRSAPARYPDSVPRQGWAEDLCRKVGVTDPDSLHACAIDLANTGSAEFAVAALTAQSTTGAAASATPVPSSGGPTPGGSSSGAPASPAGTVRDGDRVSGHLAAGETRRYSLVDLGVATEVRLFDVKPDAGLNTQPGGITISLVHQDGTPATDGSTFPGNSNAFRLIGDDSYFLSVSAQTTGGDYSFRFVTIKPQRVPVAVGDRVGGPDGLAGTGTITKPGQLDVYVFTPTTTAARIIPGDSCDFTMGITEDGPEPQIYSPLSTCSGTSLTSLKPGTRYLIMVWSDTAGTGSYSFQLAPA
ncbi:VWD domain-containing protein [Rugosimonospora acidiphila]